MRAKGDSNVHGPHTLPKEKERGEPRSTTLADLSALVLGCAVAVWLPQIHFPHDQIII